MINKHLVVSDSFPWYYVNCPDFHIWSRTMAMIPSSYSVPETMIPWSEGLPFQVKYSSETVAFDQGNVLDYASVSEIIFSCILTWHFYFALANLQMNSVCPYVIWPLVLSFPFFLGICLSFICYEFRAKGVSWYFKYWGILKISGQIGLSGSFTIVTLAPSTHNRANMKAHICRICKSPWGGKAA